MFRHDPINHQSFRFSDFCLFFSRCSRLADFFPLAVGVAPLPVFLQLHGQPTDTHQIVLPVLNTGMNQRIGLDFPLVHHFQDAE